MEQAVTTQKQIEDTITLLADWGIDATQVCADFWNEDGYQTYSRGGSGARIAADGVTALTYHDWPEGFPVDRLIEIRGGFQ